jgi:Protein of unknown function (DUF4232)
MIRHARRSLLRVAAATCLLAGAGCATAGQSQPPQPGPTVSVSPTSGPGVSTCRAADLTLSVGGSGVAAGTWSALLVFTNRSSVTCDLTGYPTLLGVGNSGSTTRATEVSDYMNGLMAPGSPRVSVAPGAKAGVIVAGSDGAGCPPPYQELRVTPPGGGDPLTVAAHLEALSANMPSCGGLRVSAVHPLADFSLSPGPT